MRSNQNAMVLVRLIGAIFVGRSGQRIAAQETERQLTTDYTVSCNR